MKKDMKYFKILVLMIFLNMITLPLYGDETSHGENKRIVSLLPSITEVLYTLGLDNQVVGVTRYCMYPPEAQEKVKVGGFVDVNYEILYSLKPDIVILRVDSDDKKNKINAMGIETIEIETRSIQGILNSLELIGTKFDRELEARENIERIQAKIDQIQEKVKGLPRPRVLVSYLRTVGAKVISEVYIAGNRTYFNELIEISGGINAYQGTDIVTSPIVTAEGILSMNPDMIIEIMSMANGTGLSDEEVLKDWEMLSDLDAYKNNKIFIFNTPYSGLPGPRLDQAVADMAKFIHPEIEWGI